MSWPSKQRTGRSEGCTSLGYLGAREAGIRLGGRQAQQDMQCCTANGGQQPHRDISTLCSLLLARSLLWLS